MVDSQYILPNNIGISLLDCKEAFQLLSKQEKLYAHYLSKASWYGGLVVLLQTSPESPVIYVLLTKIFRSQAPAELEPVATVAGLSSDEFQALLVYAAAVYANMGNYKSFGDTKFIPNLPKEKLKALVWQSKAFQENPADMEALWSLCGDLMYSLDERKKQLGLGAKGEATFFLSPPPPRRSMSSFVYLFQRISAYNTRLLKEVNAEGKTCYEIRLASVLTQANPAEGEADCKCCSTEFEGALFRVTRGDYSPIMEKVVENLQLAKTFAANTNEAQMLEEYIRSFTTGSIESHKEGSRYWIKDKGPIVESYIGFIESYRDPYGSRGEFEGFVAVVNKAMSAKFAQLVASAEQLLLELPWPKEFEKDQFLKPDFTSLDVLTFAGSGIPAGINIPNYDDIRQSEGFKNVSLGNVLAVAYSTEKEKLTFLAEEDKDLYVKWKGPSFEVQVGLHELLGHGSGKLFLQVSPGVVNICSGLLISFPQITSWYQKNETWDSKFSTIASSYEECRAECVGLYLCLNKDALKIFGYEGMEADDVSYINWLNMVRAGVLGLEFYTPENQQWRQAHMQARFVILRVLLEAGGGLVCVQHIIGSDGRPDAVISLDKSKILTVGQPAIEKFLRKLQVYKSMGDVEGGRAMYEHYSTVTEDCPEKFLTLRETVLLRKEARKLFVQANTQLQGSEVQLVEYEGNVAGLIRSFVERFADDGEQLETQLMQLYRADAKF
uniref:Dipeptidyl peptidase 3 n=1 Tax=Latimeria chalumnae TaxID=7897 RepID=H3A2H9_LATCH